MEDFSTFNAIAYCLESYGYVQEGDTPGYIRKKEKATISLSYSLLTQTMNILNFASWVFSTSRESFIMVNHFIKIDRGQNYFEVELEKYVKLIEKISSTDFAESFYIIYCGPLNVQIEKEIFENQSVFYLYMNIESSEEDIERIASYRLV